MSSQERVVLDCGSRIVITRVLCDGSPSSQPVPKDEFMGSKWDAVKQAYFFKDSEVLNVRGYPQDLKDRLDRIWIAGNTKTIAEELTRRAARAKQSKQRRLAFVAIAVIAVLCTFLVTAAFLARYAPLSGWLPLVVITLFIILAQPVGRRYAPWSILYEDLLFLKLHDAIESLSEYVNSGNEMYLAESIKALNVPSETAPSSRWGVVAGVHRSVADLVFNVTNRIAYFVRENGSNLKGINDKVIPTLRSLLPVLVNPDMNAIADWNSMVSAQFHEVQPSVGRTLAARLGRSRLIPVAASLFLGYAVSTIGFLAGSLLFSLPFVEFTKQNWGTFVVAGPAFATLFYYRPKMPSV
jgi:hypothetical protein